jgi:hypothetical protein
MSASHWPFPTTGQITVPEVDVSDEDLQKAIDQTMAYTFSQPSLGNVTINTSNTGYNGSWITSAGTSANAVWTNPQQYTISGSSSNANTVQIQGEDADLLINGKSLKKFMETMENRLAILQPDLEKLEHFAALKKAYEHYKALEALCELPKKEDDNA